MRKTLLFLICSSFLFVSGCGDRLDLENAAFVLVLGLDLDEEGRLLVHTSNPVFSQEAEKRQDLKKTAASSLHNSRVQLNAQSQGFPAVGKLQVILFSKKLAEQIDPFLLLEYLYRVAKNPTNARVVIVDGSIDGLFNAQEQMKDKPRIGVHLKDIVDTGFEGNETVDVRLQKYHYQVFEKGITPSSTELSYNNDEIKITGTSLFNSQGLYTSSLDLEETPLLLILIKEIETKSPQFTFPFSSNSSDEEGGEGHNFQSLTFAIQKVKKKVRVSVHNGQFSFKESIKMDIDLTELPAEVDLEKDKNKIKKAIENHLKQKFSNLIKKFQENEIDPVGYGLYARSFQYKEWKNVQDDWPKAFSEAKVDFNIDVTIRNQGVMK